VEAYLLTRKDWERVGDEKAVQFDLLIADRGRVKYSTLTVCAVITLYDRTVHGVHRVICIYVRAVTPVVCIHGITRYDVTVGSRWDNDITHSHSVL